MQENTSKQREGKRRKSAYVVVLGDLGRSPRMCNHAVSLANIADFSVHLVGYDQGSNLNKDVKTSSHIHIHTLTPASAWISRWLPRLLVFFFKAIWQFLTLWMALPFFRGPDFILMQNPPTIPTIVVGYLYACFHPRTKLVLDWHNYGFTILEMSLGGNPRHPLVKMARCIEAFFGPRVHSAFCVSKAMKRDLHNKWNIEANVLYDRPMDAFKPCTVEERHNLMMMLSEVYPEVLGGGPGVIGASKLTELGDDGVVRLRPERPGVLVSSTSWTPDEDFSILFDALNLYESRCEVMPTLPNLVCVITGKGPLKEYYRQLIRDQQWKHISVIMPWLEPEDYPLMLASADLGVCLHTSSSGVDLPMKVL
jgi:beta-1,4-mannosyltransferase